MAKACLLGSRICISIGLLIILLFSMFGFLIVAFSPSLTGYTIIPNVDVYGSLTRRALVTVDIHDEPQYTYTDSQGVRSRVTIQRYRMVLDKIILVDSNGTEYVILDREANIDLRGHNRMSTVIPYCHTIVEVIIVLKGVEFNATIVKDFNGDGRWDEPPLMYGFINRNDSRGMQIPYQYQLAYQKWKSTCQEHMQEWMRRRGWSNIQWSNETRCPWEHSFKMPTIPPEGLTIVIHVHFHVGTRYRTVSINYDVGIPTPEGWELPTNATITP